MTMVYITGDTHADIDISKLNTKNFPQQKDLTKQDYVIIAGDFGLVWDGSASEKWWLNWLANKNFTTLFVDGNHENFNMLRELEPVPMFGGYVRRVTDGIYHLERGQVLTIDGRKFFVMGGAKSHDMENRAEGKSWWSQEIPSTEEMERGIQALDAVGWDVDYVITHCAPKSVQQMMADWYKNDSLTSYLELIRCDLNFKRWFFGHYHIDRQINEQFVALYDRVVPV